MRKLFKIWLCGIPLWTACQSLSSLLPTSQPAFPHGEATHGCALEPNGHLEGFIKEGFAHGHALSGFYLESQWAGAHFQGSVLGPLGMEIFSWKYDPEDKWHWKGQKHHLPWNGQDVRRLICGDLFSWEISQDSGVYTGKQSPNSHITVEGKWFLKELKTQYTFSYGYFWKKKIFQMDIFWNENPLQLGKLVPLKIIISAEKSLEIKANITVNHFQ